MTCVKKEKIHEHILLWHELLSHDLHSADAVYHKNSDANFSTQKQIPTAHSNDKLGSKKLKLG